MGAPITTYSDLLAAINSLGPPPSGTVRVFRGQTKDHPTLLPSGLRHSLRKEAIWLTYSQILYHSLLPELAGTDGTLTTQMLIDYSLWLHAVAQHYGPGSDYLDVSHSLEAALWFALNEYKISHGRGLMGPPGPPDPLQDDPTAGEIVRYAPWNGPAYLYVFDLPKGNPENLTEVGTIVDVADAPELFSSSERMRVQEACLIYCRVSGAKPLDLRTRVVDGTPIKIQRPMTGAVGLDRTVAEMFPSPERDQWYARFLSVPMTYAPEPAPPVLRRPIPVTVYFDDLNPQYIQEVGFREIYIPPPLLHRWIRQTAETLDASDPIKLVAEAVPIILESPVFFPYAPADSKLWHHGLLGSDLPDRVPVYKLENGLQDGEVDLTNVLFEFSPLEKPGWERVARDEVPVELLRGIWLYRASAKADFEVNLIYQSVPGDGPNAFARFRLVYDRPSNELIAVRREGTPPLRIRDGSEITKQIGKPAIVALMLLRYLSPALKAEASPRAAFGVSEEGEEKTRFLIGCSRDAARLFRVVASPNADWFVMRHTANQQEPFTDHRVPDGTLEITTDKEFNEIPLEFIRGKLTPQSCNTEPTP